jgi:hypothetical protein
MRDETLGYIVICTHVERFETVHYERIRKILKSILKVLKQVNKILAALQEDSFVLRVLCGTDCIDQDSEPQNTASHVS